MTLTIDTSSAASVTSAKPAASATTRKAFQCYLRLKPPTRATADNERFLSVVPLDGAPTATQVTVHPPSHQNRFRAIETFDFTEVLDEEKGQNDVFNKALMPLIEAVVRDGRDGLLATLGVTGSGKTHTIFGKGEVGGMTQMALDVIFKSINDKRAVLDPENLWDYDTADSELFNFADFAKKSSVLAVPRPTFVSNPDCPSITIEKKRDEFALFISMYEVYNDRIFDLLSIPTSARRKALIFKTTRGSRDRKVIGGLEKVYVSSLKQALEVVEVGRAQRRSEGTSSNDRSSRSHCFISMELKRIVDGRIKGASTLTIVDLGGSERARNAKTAGERLAEGGHINKSLMCLGHCLQMLCSNNADKHAMIPYRQSKLTELLFTNSFPSGSVAGNNGNHLPQLANMIITADPHGDFNSTSQILRYSALAHSMTRPRSPVLAASVSSRQVSATSNFTAISPINGFDDQNSNNNNNNNSSNSGSGNNSSNISGDAAAIIASLQAQLKVAQERARDADERWQQAEERCIETEQLIREEIAAEFDARMRIMENRLMTKLQEEQEYHEEHTDKKLDLLKKSLKLTEEEEEVMEYNPELEEYARDLEEENEALREEITRLKRERLLSSPTKARA